MKVLFVSSGKSGDVGHVVKNQGESLVRHGIEIEYLTIKSGLLEYLKAIPHINRRVRKGGYDLVHAHYSLSALAATIAGCSPLVVSLMGSDAFHNSILRLIIRSLSKLKWAATIVKTSEMKSRLKLNNALVIPNGADTDRFTPIEKDTARKYLGLPPDKRIILFISVKNRPEKNFAMAKKAVESLHDASVEILHLYDTPNSEIPYYLNAADLLLLTSSREGSVNVIKEAMACNCPIVSTDVGDVSWVMSGTEGCYISGHDHESVTEKIKKALAFGRRTNGRERILEIGLDSASVAKKIIDIYRAASQNV